MIEFYVDFKIQSPNRKEHWSKGYRRNRNNYLRLLAEWSKTYPKVIYPPCTVTIERIFNPSKKQKRMDGDNFEGATKNIRDKLASIIIPGLAHGRADDEDLGIKFVYQQKKGDKDTFRIRIENEPR